MLRHGKGWSRPPLLFRGQRTEDREQRTAVLVFLFSVFCPLFSRVSAMEGCCLADKSTRLILEALGRAAAEPGGVALLASKSEPGLFPATPLAKSAAERCKDEGWLHVVRRETKGKGVREICTLTETGLQHLLHQSSPRQVLEDFVRVLEARQEEVAQLAESAHQMQQSLQAMQTAVEQVLPRLREKCDPLSENGSTHGATMNGSAALLAPPPPAATSATDALIADLKSK